jgi:hypothetical protein
MALIFHDGFETGGADAWSSTTGSPTFVSGAAKTGNYGMRCNPSASNIYAFSGLNISRRVSFYMYIASTPTTTAGVLVGSLASNSAGIRITSTNTIQLFVDNVLRDTTSALDVGKWYRVCLVATSASGCKIYIDGTEEATTATNSANALLGFVGLAGSVVTADIYFDDVVFDTTNSTDDLGDIRVLAARPTVNGTDLDTSSPKWQPRSLGIDYGGTPAANRMADDPPDTDEGAWEEADATAHYYSAALDDCGSGNLSGIGGSDTIEAVNFVYYYETNAGGTTAYYMYGRDSSGRSSTTELDDPKDPTWVAEYETQSWVTTPAAWTQTNLNNQQMGMMCQDASKDLTVNYL